MNLEKVSYLITAIEAGSFSLAAEKLGMTQSGLNRQITSLEDELKTTLLLRGRRGVVPAKGAEPVIARLRELLQHLNDVAAAPPQALLRRLSGHYPFHR